MATEEKKITAAQKAYEAYCEAAALVSDKKNGHRGAICPHRSNMHGMRRL